MYRSLIEFWFSDEASARWFNPTPEFDQQLLERFGHTWQQANRGELDHWCTSVLGSLAMVILLDQFPLNMFRGSVKSFSTEAKARSVARTAIDCGFDQEIPVGRRSFLYMPFMHSENLDDQALSLKLFDHPGLEDNFRFARHHHGVVERFGRFPHRNEILGRESTSAEIEYLNSKEGFKG